MGFSEYLIDNLGEDYVEANGHKVFHCPFCYKNHDYKLYVNDTSTEREGLWDCKRCGRVGNPVKFVMDYEKLNFEEAKSVLDNYGVISNSTYMKAKAEGLSDEEALYLMLLNINETEKKEEIVKKAPPLPGGFKLIKDNLDSPEVIPFVEYLVYERGIEPADIRKHNIGYVTKGKFTTSTGKEIGLYNHIIFITHDFEGNYMYWNTRSIEKNPYMKTINASGDADEYGRGDVVFNLNLAIKEKEIVLTEGVMDALTVGSQGVSGFGKQYTEAQIRAILNNIEPEQKLYILLDRDAITERGVGGGSATLNLSQKLYQEHENTFVVVPETNEDPNDLGRERVWELIRNNAVKASPEGRLMLELL